MDKSLFHMREINEYSGHMESCGRFSHSWGLNRKLVMWTCLAWLWLWLRKLATILGYMSGSATEKAKVIVKMALTFLCQFTIFSELLGKIRRGFLLFRCTSLLEVVPQLLLFCLDCEELLPDLESIGRFRLGFRLVDGGSGNGVFTGNFCSAFPVTGINGLGKDAETRESVWLVVVNHVILDVFCKTIVSLLKVCCISPLNSCS